MPRDELLDCLILFLHEGIHFLLKFFDRLLVTQVAINFDLEAVTDDALELTEFILKRTETLLGIARDVSGLAK